MLMSVNTAENALLTAKESNKVRSFFVLFSQKHDKTHYREHLETQHYDDFYSTHTRMSTENASTTNDPTADTVCIVIDPNKFHAKVPSKLKVVLLTRS